MKGSGEQVGEKVRSEASDNQQAFPRHLPWLGTGLLALQTHNSLNRYKTLWAGGHFLHPLLYGWRCRDSERFVSCSHLQSSGSSRVQIQTWACGFPPRLPCLSHEDRTTRGMFGQ